MNNQQGISSEVYSGMEQYGKIRSGISFIYITLFAFVFVSIGGYLAFRKETYNKKVVGKIQKSNCTVITTRSSRNYSCDLEIKYKVNDSEYVLNIIKESSTQYVLGNNIDVYVNEYNYSDATINSGYKKLGWIMMSIAIFVWILVGLNFFLSVKYKGYAAFTGASDVARSFSGDSIIIIL